MHVGGRAGLADGRDARPTAAAQAIGAALGAALFGVLLGPVIGGAATETSPELVFSRRRRRGHGDGAVGAGHPGRGARRRQSSWRDLGSALRRARCSTAIWLFLLPALFIGTIDVLVPLRLDDLGARGLTIGALFVAAAAVEALLTPVIGRLSDRRGRLPLIRLGLVGAGAGARCRCRSQDRSGAGGSAAGRRRGGLAFFWAPAAALLSEASESAGPGPGLRLRAHEPGLGGRPGGRRRRRRRAGRRDGRRRALRDPDAAVRAHLRRRARPPSAVAEPASLPASQAWSWGSGSNGLPPSYQPGALQISKCRWQPCALPVSPTRRSARRPPRGALAASGEGSLQVHVDVVLHPGRCRDHHVVAGRGLVAGGAHRARTAATSGVPHAAITSWPWWVCRCAPAPKRAPALPKLCVPRTGNTPMPPAGTGPPARRSGRQPSRRRVSGGGAHGPRRARSPPLGGTRTGTSSKRWLLTRTRRSSAPARGRRGGRCSRTSCSRSPAPAPGCRPGARGRARTGGRSATSRPPAAAAIRSGRALGDHAAAGAQHEAAATGLPRHPHPHGRGRRLARATAQVADAVAAAGEDGGVDVAQPGARHQQQAAAARLAVAAAADALDRPDARPVCLRGCPRGQHGQQTTRVVAHARGIARQTDCRGLRPAGGLPCPGALAGRRLRRRRC